MTLEQCRNGQVLHTYHHKLRIRELHLIRKCGDRTEHNREEKVLPGNQKTVRSLAGRSALLRILYESKKFYFS